ncbi:hypothetical protein J6590_034736 [Homalodisca vitripennis]|nr:hypothetical protein J6590_034736 [Homalodisca vitripennis]
MKDIHFTHTTVESTTIVFEEVEVVDVDAWFKERRSKIAFLRPDAEHHCTILFRRHIKEIAAHSKNQEVYIKGDVLIIIYYLVWLERTTLFQQYMTFQRILYRQTDRYVERLTEITFFQPHYFVQPVVMADRLWMECRRAAAELVAFLTSPVDHPKAGSRHTSARLFNHRLQHGDVSPRLLTFPTTHFGSSVFLMDPQPPPGFTSNKAATRGFDERLLRSSLTSIASFHSREMRSKAAAWIGDR